MDTEVIVKIMDEFVAHGLTRLSVKQDGFEIELAKEAVKTVVTENIVNMPVQSEKPQVTVADEDTEKSAGEYVTSPLVGTFYVAASEGASPYVKPGDTVKQGTVMCLIEAMKMMNEVMAPYDCVVKKVCAVNGELVEFGGQLFEVEKL